MISSNPFQVLEEVEEEKAKEEGDSDKARETEMKEAVNERNSGNRPVIMEEHEDEGMYLSDLDLDTLEEECRKAGSGYVPREQIKLLQQAIIRSKAHKDLGISVEGQKGSKRKTPEEDQKRGRKPNKQRIAEIGVKLIELGQYPTIKATFSEVSKVSL